MFASANLEYPEAVAEARGLRVLPFARNKLRALAQPAIKLTPDTTS